MITAAAQKRGGKKPAMTVEVGRILLAGAGLMTLMVSIYLTLFDGRTGF